MITNSFIKRSISGFIFVLILVSGIFFSQYSFLLLFAIISLIAMNEFNTLFKSYIDKTFKFLISIFHILILIFFIINKANFDKYGSLYFYSGLSFILILANITFLVTNLFKTKHANLQAPHIAIFNLLYICIPFILFMDIAFINGTYSPFIIFTIILLIWTNDTGAYIVGRLIGRKALFKSVSPNKTREGFIGGLLTTLISILLLYYLFNKELEIIGKFAWITIGLIVSILGAIGDLIESKLKRFLQVKDSGNILPGHGGLLDRFDALLIVAPIIKIYLIFIL